MRTPANKVCRVPPLAPSKKSRLLFNSLITYSTSLIVLKVHEALVLANACTLLSDILSTIGNFNCSLHQESVLTHTHWCGLCVRI
jgi:hypothetical protein